MREVASLFPENEALDARKGAYLLLVELAKPLSLTQRGKPVSLAAGTYAYCGSANGPGGIAARVARHMRKDKKAHWHVDALTVAAREFAPDLFIITGPGTTLGGAVAQSLITAEWRGMASKADFRELQDEQPLLVSMGMAEQRGMATGQRASA